MIIIKKGSIGMVLITTLFVVIAGLSALVGGLIGNKIFPNNATQ